MDRIVSAWIGPTEIVVEAKQALAVSRQRSPAERLDVSCGATVLPYRTAAAVDDLPGCSRTSLEIPAEIDFSKKQSRPTVGCIDWRAPVA